MCTTTQTIHMGMLAYYLPWCFPIPYKREIFCTPKLYGKDFAYLAWVVVLYFNKPNHMVWVLSLLLTQATNLAGLGPDSGY